MEFNEKLQELRKQKGITQEELAERLYVSRTAVSKWESGRGYPNIESLKALASFFSVTVDELISTDQALSIAEADGREKEKRLCDLVSGLLDVSMANSLFLPLFAHKGEAVIQSVSLIALDTSQPYLKAVYLATVIVIALMGVLTLALQNLKAPLWVKSKTAISLSLGVAAVLIFVISQQPYAAVFAFVLLTVKALLHVKWR